jgi:ABC-type multidrug transport system ATPase subunit
LQQVVEKQETSSKALSFDSVSKRYRRQAPLLDSITFDLDYGEIAVISGPSGSGKSTILQIATGLLSQDSGTVAINGLVLTRENMRQRSILRTSLLSYIPQDDYLFETLTVEENVALAFELHGEKPDPNKTHGMLALLGIERLASREIAEISAGERRRVSIARGMVRDPKILVIDEPTSSLDADNTVALMKLFRQISAKRSAFLIASHDINELRSYTDKLYQIKDTRLIAI